MTARCAYAGCGTTHKTEDVSAIPGERLFLCQAHAEAFRNMLLGYQIAADGKFQKIFRWYKCRGDAPLPFKCEDAMPAEVFDRG